MTTTEEGAGRTDGRAARRQRNVDAVLDVVIELFGEDALFPTIEQVAQRSGLSLRSLYRYFADQSELLEAAIGRQQGIIRQLSHLPAIGQGPLDERIRSFVSTRLSVYDAVGHVMRASLANAPHHPRIRHQLQTGRNNQRGQFEMQFAPELAGRKPADRDAVLAAGDLLTQLESIDFLRRHRRLTVAEATTVLTTALHSLLD